MKYRIVKRTDVLYDCAKPKRRYWYVIQQRIITCVCLWIPIWMDMEFDDYPGSKMTFDELDDAKNYIKKLRNLN